MQKNFKVIAIVIFVVVAAFLAIMYSMSKRDGSEVITFDGDVTVEMGEDTYIPQNIRIKKGSKVTFVNGSESLRWPASDLHPSHLVFPDFDPRSPVEKGKSWEFTFNDAGEWGYHDHLAPYITGTILVTE